MKWGQWEDVTGASTGKRIKKLRKTMMNNETIVKVVCNNIYQVIVLEVSSYGEVPTLIHLSIKSLDQSARHDWRHLQRIKNELVGKECEGVELYPKDSRVVDTANQFHLWVFQDPQVAYPFGYGDRLVFGPGEITKQTGAKQRPFEPDDPIEMTELSEDQKKILRGI